MSTPLSMLTHSIEMEVPCMVVVFSIDVMTDLNREGKEGVKYSTAMTHKFVVEEN